MPLSAYLHEGLAYQLPKPIAPPSFESAAPTEFAQAGMALPQ